MSFTYQVQFGTGTIPSPSGDVPFVPEPVTVTGVVTVDTDDDDLLYFENEEEEVIFGGHWRDILWFKRIEG